MCYLDKSFCKEEDPNLIPHAQGIWGPSYFLDEGTQKVIRNFWVHEVSECARYAVPFIKNIDLLL
jgi:hypothetical protein